MTDMTFTVKPKALVQTEVAPAESRLLRDGTLFLDFGKAAFGTLIVPVAPDQESVTVCLGEKLGADGRIDREPPGTIRFIRIEQSVGEGEASCRIIIPSDPRNTGPVAIKMPSDIGEVYPFRYAEIKDPGDMDPSAVRQVCVHYPFDEAASSFQSSDSVLNAVWELCKYSIKATTFCGVYVDGDRERIPYEGDAYINQLGHYAVDCEYALARYTHEYLIQHPTWPTEWQLHSVMMAWADYMYTGETQSLETFYDDLCVKTLVGLAREDGLISTESELCTRKFEERLHLHYSPHVSGNGLKDLVDWPPGSFTEGGAGERDNHEMLPVNTVVNAFHYHALALMSRIADVLGRSGDRERFASQAARVKSAINRLLYDEAQGVYVDGEGAKHASLHSNMTVLAFGLVPEERIPTVVSHVKSRGMACSVYGAQYLLEALYLSGEDACALGLMTAKSERSWWNMMQIGSTITLEAWDWKYKSDLDWNHAWGAVPANIIPRFLMGVRPLEAGFAKVLIQPRPGGLETARIKIPTIRGTIAVGFENHPEKPFVLEVDIPRDMTARIDIPALGRPGGDIGVDGKPMTGVLNGDFVTLDPIGAGRHTLERTRGLR